MWACSARDTAVRSRTATRLTHQEFLEAEHSGLRTSVWAQEEIEREGPQQSFVEEVRAFGVTGGYRTPEELEVEPKVAQLPQPTRIAFDGMSWEELTKIAIKVAFFGVPNPLGVMQHMVQLQNPFPALQAAGVSEEALRPIARLLISEILIVERGVERLVGFRLGRSIRGRRRLRIAYQVPAPYSNQLAPQPFEVEGDVQA